MKLKYVIKRLLMAIPTFIGICILAYFVSDLAPGSPIDAYLADPKVTPMELERLKVQMGLDRSVWMQFVGWFGQLLQGNLGYSFSASRLPVAQLIGERLGNTLLLSLSALFLSILIALPLGIFAASKPKSLRDYLSGGFSFIAVGTPNFFAALILIYIFAVRLKILPSGGMYDSVGVKTPLMLAKHMVLPVAVLSMQHIGSLIRYTRNGLLEVTKEDYIRTARAKGYVRTAAIRKHAVKNSLLPIITVIGMSIPSLVGGAVVTEQVFSWPGIGSLMVSSILNRDYPVIMGVTVLISVIVLIANIITDLLYGMLDPRITYK